MRPYRGGSFALPGDCPVTWAVIASNVLSFLTAFLGVVEWGPLAFRSFAVVTAPWTVLTYPLVFTGSILGLLLGGYVFWLFGGSLERGWGRRDYLVFLALVSAAPAIALWIGGGLTGRTVILSGPWLPLAAATVAWAAINPYERLLLYFVIPIEARWIGVLAAVLVLFSSPFPLGIFALAGCGVAWWYVRQGRYSLLRGRSRPAWDPPQRPRREGPHPLLNPLAWYRRWRQRKQFRRLIDSSDLRDLDEGKGPH